MKKYAIITLLSVTLISLELTWTRILSAEFFYTFAFLILSIAVLGLGTGALAVRLFLALNKENTIGISLSAAGIMALVGPFLVFKSGIDFSQLLSQPVTVMTLMLIILILSSAFFFGGIALALLFRNNNKQLPRLYMADLFGSGFGVVLAILLMNIFGTPSATCLLVLPILFASIIALPRFLKLLPIILIIAVFLVRPFADKWLEAPQKERGPIIYKHWDAMAKIKMFCYPKDEARGIVIDNVANSPVYRFDGEYTFPEGTPKDQWGIPVGDLIHRFDNCSFLSLGAGGGADVLQALMEGAQEVHAVEVNPWLNKMLLYGDSTGYLKSYLDTLKTDLIDLPEYTSRFYYNPKVKVVSEDARAYVRRYKNKFDIIYSLSSNTFSALASGSFAMAENYLFTTEAFMDYWHALSDSGFLMMEHQFYMPRLVSDVSDALDRLKVTNPKSHFAVYNLPKLRRNVLLLSKQPLTSEILQTALIDLSPETNADIYLLYPAADSMKNNPIQQIVDYGWSVVADTMAFNISPNTDDRPFAAQMGLWKNLKLKGVEKLLPYEFHGFPIAKLIIVIILMVVMVMFVPLTLLPYFKKGQKLKAAPWLYFFSTGMAFMSIEVVLIQKFTLFVGPSVYSFATILATLLIMSGIGSFFAPRFKDFVPFIAIILWILIDIIFLTKVTSGLGLNQMVRIIITALFIAPLGFFMGMPFPKAGVVVGDLVDWGFAVNGVASVFGATLIMLIVFSVGYTVGLLAGGILYLLSWILFKINKGW